MRLHFLLEDDSIKFGYIDGGNTEFIYGQGSSKKNKPINFSIINVKECKFAILIPAFYCSKIIHLSINGGTISAQGIDKNYFRNNSYYFEL